MYHDNGLKILPRLENIFRDLKIERTEQPEEFLHTIDQDVNEEGAYFCTPVELRIPLRQDMACLRI